MSDSSPDSSSRQAKPKPDSVRVTAAKCVRCGNVVEPRFRPFCSQRCADIDLAGWLTGQYRIPTEEQPESPADARPPEDEDIL